MTNSSMNREFLLWSTLADVVIIVLIYKAQGLTLDKVKIDIGPWPSSHQDLGLTGWRYFFLT